MDVDTESRIRSSTEGVLATTRPIVTRLLVRGRVPMGVHFSRLAVTPFSVVQQFQDTVQPLTPTTLHKRLFGEPCNDIRYSAKLSLFLWLASTPIGAFIVADTDIATEKFIYLVSIHAPYRGGWATVLLKHVATKQLVADGVRTVIYYAMDGNRDTFSHAQKANRIVTDA